jgi:hypothetical protein
MHDSNHVADRIACTLPKPDLTQEEAASEAAKAIFAREGDFLLPSDPQIQGIKPIPAKTKFRVYEFAPEAGRDEVVNLILPAPSDKFPDPFVAVDWYPCTYWPYL